MSTRRPRVFAAVSLDEGGGVAAASRLLWRSLQERWGSESELLTLLNGKDALTTSRKLRFGSKAMGAQVLGRARWVLFNHLGVARVQTMLPARVQRPYGVFLHGVEVWRDLPESDLRVLARASLRIANSEHTAQRVMEMHPGIGPVFPCPLALAPEDEHPVFRPDVRASAEPTVLMVGRMDAAEAYKGHGEAIAAWPLVVREVPSARLVIAGSGDDLERLKNVAARSGAADRIEFLGFVDRMTLLDWYQRASVFLMPSRGEGFGIVYLEAMAHRLACIGSRHDAAGDVIRDGETGFLVSQDDIAEIASRVVLLLRDRELCARLGEAGHARFEHVFSYRQFSARLVGLIESHLERPAAVPSTRQSTARANGQRALG